MVSYFLPVIICGLISYSYIRKRLKRNAIESAWILLLYFNFIFQPILINCRMFTALEIRMDFLKSTNIPLGIRCICYMIYGIIISITEKVAWRLYNDD